METDLSSMMSLNLNKQCIGKTVLTVNAWKVMNTIEAILKIHSCRLSDAFGRLRLEILGRFF